MSGRSELLARAFESVEEAFEGREPARQALESDVGLWHPIIGMYLPQDDQLDGVRTIFIEPGAHTNYVFRPNGNEQLA